MYESDVSQRPPLVSAGSLRVDRFPAGGENEELLGRERESRRGENRELSLPTVFLPHC